jgi:hypothetical protein
MNHEQDLPAIIHESYVHSAGVGSLALQEAMMTDGKPIDCSRCLASAEDFERLSDQFNVSPHTGLGAWNMVAATCLTQEDAYPSVPLRHGVTKDNLHVVDMRSVSRRIAVSRLTTEAWVNCNNDTLGFLTNAVGAWVGYGDLLTMLPGYSRLSIN